MALSVSGSWRLILLFKPLWNCALFFLAAYLSLQFGTLRLKTLETFKWTIQCPLVRNVELLEAAKLLWQIHRYPGCCMRKCTLLVISAFSRLCVTLHTRHQKEVQGFDHGRKT